MTYDILSILPVCLQFCTVFRLIDFRLLDFVDFLDFRVYSLFRLYRLDLDDDVSLMLLPCKAFYRNSYYALMWWC